MRSQNISSVTLPARVNGGVSSASFIRQTRDMAPPPRGGRPRRSNTAAADEGQQGGRACSADLALFQRPRPCAYGKFGGLIASFDLSW